ncbi:MAG TPA: hypothetical protein VL523_18630 [Terriglobia bacterium]|nr:hypothetical protein [Terriglobia bacterium]
MALWIYVVPWAILALVVLGMAIYRNLLGIHENPVHVSPTAGMTEVKAFRKEDLIERWGQRLTVITIVYGFVLAIVYLLEVTENGPLR